MKFEEEESKEKFERKLENGEQGEMRTTRRN